MDIAHSPVALTRLSLWTFLTQAIVDAVAFAGHITFCNLGKRLTIHVSRRPGVPRLPFVRPRGRE